MNPSQAQSDSDPASTYFDPDGPDMSEEQFSASLEVKTPKVQTDVENRPPRFVVDAPEVHEVPERPLIPQTSTVWGQPPPAVPVERSSTPGGASAGLPAEDGCADQAKFGDSDLEPDWRDQVAAKVTSYKSRRPRKERYPSLQLQFEPSADGVLRSTRPDQNVTFSQSIAVQSTELRPAPAMSAEATARVIQFPRSAAAPVTKDELADPVMDRPRILEAPELLPPLPAMGGILIEAVSQPEPERRAGFEMPLQSAALSRRFFAGAIDAAVVAIALTAFGYIFLRIAGTVPQWRTAVELAAVLLALLWPAYQYAFLVFSGVTPGLRAAKLQVTRFDGAPASRSLRRWRVIASVLSCVSLGLGYAWCFLDEDQLSWHDRITRTHLGPALPVASSTRQATQ